MAWTTLAASDYDPESPITTDLISVLYNNVAGAFNKDSGAPVLANSYIVTAMYNAGSVDQAAIGALAVGQSEIKTTYQEHSVTSVITSYTVATGGAYTLGLTCWSTDAANLYDGLMDNAGTGGTANGSSEQGRRWGLTCGTYYTGTVYGRMHYINASPPSGRINIQANTGC